MDSPGVRLGTTAVARVIKPDDRNDGFIRCRAPRIRLSHIGLTTTDFTEFDGPVSCSGRVGLRIHAVDPSEVWRKDLGGSWSNSGGGSSVL